MRYISKTKLWICILTFIIIFQDSIKEITHISIVDYFDEILILFFAIRALIYACRQKKIPELSGKILFLTGMFAAIGILGCLFNSSFRTFDLIMGSILMIKIYLLIIATLILPWNTSQFDFFIESILFIGKICLVTGAVNFFVPTVWTNIIPYVYSYERNGLPSVMGLFIHAGQFGWFMLLVAIIYYSYYICNGNKKDLYRFVIYAIAACTSMKVKVFIGIILIVLFNTFVLQKKKISPNKIIISLFGVALIWFVFKNVITATYTMYFTDSTGSARFALLSGSLRILIDFFPLGVGFSKFGSYYAKVHYSEWYYKYGLNTVWGLRPGETFFGTDTFWPAIIGETGALGVIIYILILMVIFFNLKRVFDSSNGNKSNQILSCLGLLIFVQALAESTGEPIFNSSPQNIVIGLFIGNVLARYYYTFKEKNDDQK